MLIITAAILALTVNVAAVVIAVIIVIPIAPISMGRITTLLFLTLTRSKFLSDAALPFTKMLILRFLLEEVYFLSIPVLDSIALKTSDNFEQAKLWCLPTTSPNLPCIITFVISILYTFKCKNKPV